MESFELINNIKKVLLKNPYFVCNQCYLRGSYANKMNNLGSDIDLLLVSIDFQSISFFKRRELVYKAMQEIGYKVVIDAICLSKEEYSRLINEEREMFYNERMIKIL